jgi:prephenate dehydrogenase
VANRDAIAADIESFQEALTRIAAQIRNGDAQSLGALFEAARNARQAWLQSKE